MPRANAALCLALACLLPGADAEAQEGADEESPRVESIVFEGVSGLDEDLLRDSIATRETSCRGFLLRPFCALSDAGIFVEKHDLDRRQLALDEIRIRVVYFRRGYREARVETALAPEGEGVAVTFRVDEGPLTRVGSLTVTQTDSVLTADEIADAGLPDAGEPLDLNRVDSARIRLRNRIWDEGRGDVEVADSVVIDPATHTAALHVLVDAGPVTTIEEVVVEGNEGVSDYTVQRLFGLSAGDLYRRTRMATAERRLVESELFRQSLVFVPPTPDSAKTVRISVREAPPRSVRLSPGFNTVEFVQGEARFTHHDWLGGARRLDLRVAVGNLLAPQLYGRSLLGSTVPQGLDGDVDDAYLAPTWQVGANLTQPFVRSPRTSLGLGVSAHRRSIPGIVIDRGFALNASLTHRLLDDAPLSLTYGFERTHVEAGDVYFCISFGVCDPGTIAALQSAHRLSPLGLSAWIERADDALDPRSGYRAEVALEHASALTASDFAYHRATGDASHYRALGRGVLAGHVRAGWVRALEGTLAALDVPEGARDVVHPRRRLLAGGARSVRGYAENQLGPRVLTAPPSALIQPSEPTGTPACTPASVRDGTCDPEAAPSADFQPRPLGGNTLLEASLEYRHPLTGTLTGALFVDAGVLRGQRLNFPPGTRGAVTPGFGIRYLSPIGHVRLDVGIRPARVEELPVVTEVIGPDGEPRLVQLETPKRYDPLEGRSGLGRILSRLQLHLALGEAF